MINRSRTPRDARDLIRMFERGELDVFDVLEMARHFAQDEEGLKKLRDRVRHSKKRSEKNESKEEADGEDGNNQ